MLTADQIVGNAGPALGAVACAASGSGLGELVCGWRSIAILALVVSSVLMAFLYFFSVLFRNDGLKNFVRLEYTELFVSALLVIAIVGLISLVSNMGIGSLIPSSSMPPGVNPDSNIYNLTESYFNEVGEDMGVWLEMNYILTVYVDSYASVTPYARPMGVGLVASPLAGLASPFKTLLNNMSSALAVAYIINYAQLYVFLFTLAASLYYFIPLGLILRCFSPTRRLGGSLIGLGVSFLLVFPILYCLNYMMFYSDDTSPMITFRSFINQKFASTAKDYASPNEDISDANKFGDVLDDPFKKNYTPGFIDLLSSGLGGIGQIFTSIIGNFFTLLMVLPLATIGRAFAIGFIMPVFDIMLLVQATKSLSKGLGEELDVSALTRLV